MSQNKKYRKYSPEFKLRPSTCDDQPFLDRLLKRNYDHLKEGFAYPRCETTAELLAELKLYGLNLDQAIYILEANDKPVATFGFLYNPEETGTGSMIEKASDAKSYGIGPLLEPHWYSRVYIQTSLTHMEDLAAKRSVCLVDQNQTMAELFKLRNWSAQTSSLEMKWTANKSQPQQKKISSVQVIRIKQTENKRLSQGAKKQVSE